ncbi:MAG: SDR family oxidoreductase [Acidimicrobiia bacterium]|nr:SDR family oxidoreductase [Acidimicrobiia bacterium]
MHDTPVAIVANASFYVGPSLAMKLADAGFDLVLGDPTPEVIAHVGSAGRNSWVVDGVADLADPASAPRLLDMAMDAYGRLDSAVFFSGGIVMGRMLDSSDADFEAVVAGNLEAPYRALRTFGRPMVDSGSGQMLAITSSSGIKPTPNATLYSATRAGANMLVRNFAAEVARHGVQVNAVGTNFMDFPAFREATGADDPEVMAKITRNVPMGRLGTMDEFADFCLGFLDGKSRFHTGQVVGFDGGWSAT